MQFVREFFELNRFHVLTHWQHDAPVARGVDSTALLFAENSQPEALGPLPFLLRPAELSGLRRAVVEVRAWHGDRFYPSVVENSAVLSHVVQEETLNLARSVFGSPDFVTVLILSELPASPRHRARSLELLQGRGIGHVLEFPTILQDMLAHVSVDGNYAPSQTLQTLRLLKRYNLLRRQQLEFSFPHGPVTPGKEPDEGTFPED